MSIFSSSAAVIDDLADRPEPTTAAKWRAVIGDGCEVKHFEHVQLDAFPDTTLYAGQDTSATSIARRARKALLIAAVADLAKAAPSWDGDEVRVSTGAAGAAARFIIALPENRALPQIAPDGEGDVMLVWAQGAGDCVVTVERDKVHLVVDATTTHAQHIDGVPFGTGYHHIPIPVLNRLPTR